MSCTERRLKHSQSGRILQLLYSLTPYGRKNLRESDELVPSGHDSYDIAAPFIDEPTEDEKAMLKSIYEDKDKFVKQGNELKKLFASYRGKLLNPANGRKLNKHEGKDDPLDHEEDWVEVADVVIDYMKRSDPTDTGANETSSDDSTSEYSDDEGYFDLGDENIAEETNGVFQDNIATLKMIAALHGYDEDKKELLVTQYSDWLVEDPATFLVNMGPTTISTLFKCQICQKILFCFHFNKDNSVCYVDYFKLIFKKIRPLAP